MTREERREYMRKWRAANHYKILEYQRNYHRNHREKDKAYYQKNREKYRAYSREYYKDCRWKWEEIYRPRQIVKKAKEIEK